MARGGKPVTRFSASREIPASVEQVFATLGHSQCLARWRGPANEQDLDRLSTEVLRKPIGG